jgi:uncharacterized protein
MPQLTREELGRKLLYDIATGDVDNALSLIDAGAWLTVKDGEGRVALHMAALCNHTDILNVLLTQVSDPDPKDDKGNTPLMDAATMGHSVIVSSLLGAGASITTRNADGKSALDFAKDSGYLDIISMIVDVQAEAQRKLAETWNTVATHVDHEVAVSKPLQLKAWPKL